MGLFFTTLVGWGGVIERFLGGFTAVNTGSPETSSGHWNSVDFTNASEYLRSNTSTIGIANTWSIMFWGFPSSISTAMSVLDIKPSGSNNNRIHIDYDTTGDIYCAIYDSSGTLIKDYEWTNGSMGMNVNNWMQYVFTWDGTDLFCTSNGTKYTKNTAHTDGTGTMTDTSRIVTVGTDNAGANAYQGRIHGIAIWDVVLTTDAIIDMSNHGKASIMDLSRNKGAYTNSGDLQHWWKLGHDPTAIGADYVGSISLDDASSGIDITDVRHDAPSGSFINFNAHAGGQAATEYLLNSTGQAYGIADTYTIAVWVHQVTVPSSERQVIFEITDDTTADKERCAVIIESTRDWGFLVGDASSTTKVVSTGQVTRTAEFYHVVCVKDGTTEMAVWVNGVKDATDGTSIPTQTNEADRIASVCANALDLQDAGDSKVSEICVWDVALPDAAIVTLHNEGRQHIDLQSNFENYTQSADIVHHWRLGLAAKSTETGNGYVTAVTGGVDLSANDSGVTVAQDHLNDDMDVGRFINFGDNADDRMENTSVAAVGIANQFSVSFWMNQRVAPTGFETALDFRSGSNGSIMQLGFDGTITGNPLSCALTNTANTLFKNLDFTDTDSDDGSWHHYVITFDGDDTGDPLLGYRNGVVSASSGTDNTGTMADANREICLADSVLNTTPNAYQLAQFAVWNTVLSANEIRFINSGGWDLDLTSDTDNYTKSSNLQHWWQIGNNSSNIGEDTGNGTARDLTPNSITYKKEALLGYPYRRQ